MDFTTYQKEAKKTAIYPESGQGTLGSLSYAVLGLTNEAGESAGKLKKTIRDSNGVIDDAAKLAIAGELSDVIWYIAAVATELGFDLNSIAESNLAKLADRQQRGVLSGSGDHR